MGGEKKREGRRKGYHDKGKEGAHRGNSDNDIRKVTCEGLQKNYREALEHSFDLNVVLVCFRS